MKNFEIEYYVKLLNALVNYFALFSGQNILKIFKIQPNIKSILNEVSNIEKIIEDFKSEKYESNEMISLCYLVEKVIKLDYFYILNTFEIFNVIEHLCDIRCAVCSDPVNSNIDIANDLLNIMLYGINKVHSNSLKVGDIILLDEATIIKKITKKLIHFKYRTMQKTHFAHFVLNGYTERLYLLDIYSCDPYHNILAPID